MPGICFANKDIDDLAEVQLPKVLNAKNNASTFNRLRAMTKIKCPRKCNILAKH